MNLRPSVCIDAVLENRSIEEAAATVRACGIDAIEFWAWWEKDLDKLIEARNRSSLILAACCTKFVSLVDPDERNDYLTGLEESIASARRLGISTLISQVGDACPGVSRNAQLACLVEGLKAAAPMLEAADITLVIEPLNEMIDHPGYFLVRSQEAFQIIDEVASPRVKVVFDIYHQQISEGHLIHNIISNIDKIGHFHAAGNPGRHELTDGEINYPQIFEAIRRTNYDGYVGLEYWPLQSPEKGLRDVNSWF